MKLFKKISAIVLATAMFGMSAMAAVTLPSKIEVESDATQVTVIMSADAGTTMGSFAASFILYYDTSIFSYNSELSTCNYGEVDNTPDNDACIMWGTSVNVTVAADKTDIATFVFDIKEGQDADGAVFTLAEDDWQMFIDEDFSDLIPFPDNAEVTVEVKEPAPVDPVPGTVGEKDGKTTVVDDNKATRFVVSATATNISATSASVLNATYDGETQSANLYKLLGVENEGNITIGSLTVKAVLPATVENASDVGAFSITVE